MKHLGHSIRKPQHISSNEVSRFSQICLFKNKSKSKLFCRTLLLKGPTAYSGYESVFFTKNIQFAYLPIKPYLFCPFCSYSLRAFGLLTYYCYLFHKVSYYIKWVTTSWTCCMRMKYCMKKSLKPITIFHWFLCKRMP